ncbi:MAG: exodeoxyribonuclease VII large subunit [Opitutaceae bacterium]
MFDRFSERRWVGGPSGPREEDGAQVRSVSELTRAIKALLETEFPAGWVRGEVSNLRLQASGHYYFSLKDAAAQIACVMFRGDAARSGSGALLRDGAQVLVFGSLGVYEPRGSYQLIVRVAVDDGAGRLQAEFERLKQRLAAEGLFDPARKRALPVVPEVVGFITSPTGAAVQDFIRILKRRRWAGRLVVIPVKVQGAGAAEAMVGALRLAAGLERMESDRGARPLFDLLVIGRGGGSLEDLWAFNEEPLVRAVAECPVPVISAVGHEIDFTLCDFAADVRAETPSAAAELVSSGFLDFAERVRQLAIGLRQFSQNQLRVRRDALNLLAASLRAFSPEARIEKAFMQVDDAHNRLARGLREQILRRRDVLAELRMRLVSVSPAQRFERSRDRLRVAADHLEKSAARHLASEERRLAQLSKRLQALGPDAILARGFVIVRDAEGRPVTSRASIVADAQVRAQFHDGEARLRAEG